MRSMKNAFQLIVPKTPGQERYAQILKSPKPITIATGPAGSGKTLLVVQEAVNCFKTTDIHKIVLTRPTLPTDEDIGYLPGTLEEKLNPWMRPIYDCLQHSYSESQIRRLIDDKEIEIAPLAFMRGRTFHNCFIIADEMQNSTSGQMKMLLTRIGYNTKMVVTGDLEQSDREGINGLENLLSHMEMINIDDLEYLEHAQLENEDVRRHPAVREILNLYRK